MKRRWSTLSGMPVTTNEGEKLLGRLNALFMNPESGQIIAFLVGFSRVLTPADIETWGKESLNIDSEEVLVSPFEILRLRDHGLRRCLLNNKKVISQSGKRFGRLQDFTIDTRTASLLTFEVAKTFLWFKWDYRTFPIQDVSTVNETSIILTVEPEQKQRLLSGKRATASST